MALGGNWFCILQAPADVSKVRPTHGQILQWNNTTRHWELVLTGVLGAADFAYFGDPATNGTWRIGRSGNNLNFERREAGLWVRKGAMLP